MDALFAFEYYNGLRRTIFKFTNELSSEQSSLSACALL